MANKKINQLVAKTTIQSTDLFPIGDATTGTLFKKTIADLQAATIFLKLQLLRIAILLRQEQELRLA